MLKMRLITKRTYGLPLYRFEKVLSCHSIDLTW